MAYRSKRPATEPRPAPPMMPRELARWDPAEWVSLDDPAEPPDDGFDVAGWSRWEGGQHRAYQHHLAAREAWVDEHGVPPLVVADLPGDEPFNADEMLVFDGRRVSRAELAEIQDEMRSNARSLP